MAPKWDELAGETGEEVPSSRWTRMLRLGGLGVKVSASAMANRLGTVMRSKQNRRESLRRLHEKNAERIVRVLGELKGASMKIGQILSSDPDLIPAEYVDRLSILQRDAPPMTYVTVKEQIETALDRPIDAVFEYFDPVPIGSASIGQVHQGRLKTGEKVAIKVQYPGILATLQSDIKNLGSLLQLTRAVIDKQRVQEYLEECRRAIFEEADYEAEAANLERFADHFSTRAGARVPRPFLEWTRPSVLTMELVEGVKLDDALAAIDDGERRGEVLRNWVATYVWMFHELLELHADPHPGNFLLDADDNLCLLDFGCVKAFDVEFTDGLLHVLDACWQHDDERAARCYRALGFGKASADPSIFDPEMLRQYHALVLAPFLTDDEFDFGSWRPRARIQRWVLKNPRFLKLTPPADALLYFRVLSGIKGLLAKSDARINMFQMAVETARRRGLLSGEPRAWN